MDKWSRLNPGDDVDVPADMTRLTLDTIALCGFGYRFNSFYRDTPHPFVAGDGAHAGRGAGPDAGSCRSRRSCRIRAQRQVEEDQAFMNSLVDGLIAERRAQGDAADNTDLLGRMLTGVDKQSGRGAAGRQHPRPVHHLPHRRPRDDQRAALLRDLLPAEEPGRPGSGRGPRSTQVLGDDARARRYEQIHRLHLHPPGPRRGAAAVAHRAGVHPLPLRGHRDRRPVRHPGAHPDHGADPDAAPRPAVWGAGRREFNPEHMAPERLATHLRRTPTSRSAPASAPASAGSSPCRRPCSCSACCCSASTSSTTSTTSCRPRRR